MSAKKRNGRNREKSFLSGLHIPLFLFPGIMTPRWKRQNRGFQGLPKLIKHQADEINLMGLKPSNKQFSFSEASSLVHFCRQLTSCIKYISFTCCLFYYRYFFFNGIITSWFLASRIFHHLPNRCSWPIPATRKSPFGENSRQFTNPLTGIEKISWTFFESWLLFQTRIWPSHDPVNKQICQSIILRIKHDFRGLTSGKHISVL